MYNEATLLDRVCFVLQINYIGIYFLSIKLKLTEKIFLNYEIWQVMQGVLLVSA